MTNNLATTWRLISTAPLEKRIMLKCDNSADDVYWEATGEIESEGRVFIIACDDYASSAPAYQPTHWRPYEQA